MNKNITTLLLTISFLLTLCPCASAQTQRDSIKSVPTDTTFQRMSYEEFVAYSDSIYRSKYPQPTDTFIGKESRIEDNTLTPSRTSVFFEENNYVPNYVTLDQTRIVGEIPIESGMTPTGGKTYNVPINSYSSEGIFSPQISLTYNSQQGNGVMGMGWAVSGIQIITRGSKSIYYDGEAAPIQNSASDALYLNGSRLILIYNGTTEKKYESETGHIKVVGHCSNNHLGYFTAYYPNGYIAIFGYSGNTTDVLSYPLRSLTDDKGNTITYTYLQYNNHYNISRIDYGTSYITFTYSTTRPDIIDYYCAGLYTGENRLLQTVNSYYNGNLLNTYSMTYATQDSTSVLTQIDYESNGELLNPLKFYYGTGIASRTINDQTMNLMAGYTFTDPNQIVAVRGRFDYSIADDGIISYPYNDPYWMSLYWGGYLLTNQYDNNSNAQNIYLYTGLANNYTMTIPNLTVGTSFIRMVCADIDGKQEEYPIKINNPVNGDGEQVIFNTYQKNIITGLSLKYTRTFSLSTYYENFSGQKYAIPKDYFVGDFDGDGRMEIMAISANNPFGESNHPSMCYIFDLRENRIMMQANMLTYTRAFNGVGIPSVVSDYLEAVDIDGDGKTDLVHIDGNGVKVYSFQKSGNNLTYQLAYTYSGLTKTMLQDRSLMFGDFNGDRLVDLLISPSSTTSSDITWNIHTNKGKGQFHTNYSFTASPNNNLTHHILQDVDGDGTTDLVYNYDHYGTVYYIRNGHVKDLSAFSVEANSKIVPISMSSSTSSSSLISYKDLNAKLSWCVKDERKDLLATGMANSLGIMEKNHYSLLSQRAQYNGIYTIGNDAVYPYSNISEPIAALSADEKYTDFTKIDQNVYFYTNAVLHRQGLGFRGFGVIRKQDYQSQYTTTTYNPYNFGNIAGIVTPTRSISYTYDTTVQSNKIRKNNVLQSIDEDILKGVAWTTAYSYNTYDSPTSIIRTSGDYQINQQFTLSNQTNLSLRYQLGIVNSSTETITKGNSSLAKTTSYSSFNSDYLPCSISETIGGSYVRRTTRTYDTAGRITSESIKKYSSNDPLTTTYTYNTAGLLTQVTDPLGNNTTFTYNTRGQIASKTENIGTTNYTYDALDRIVWEKLPDGTENTVAYDWGSSSFCYSITNTSTASPMTVIAYDARNREVRKSQKRFDGVMTHTAMQYDAYGNLTKVSQPYQYYASEWNEYLYDSYNRLFQYSEASGKVTHYSYQNNSVTIDDGRNPVTKYYDAMGRLYQIEDESGTTTYTLHANGNPLSVDVLGNTVSFTYDMFGRRTSMTDPSCGTTSYQYDTAGNVSLITDANNHQTNMVYDVYGRLTNKSQNEFSTSITYNNVFNKVSNIVSSNGVSRYFALDSRGHVVNERENAADGRWFQRTYNYSSDGCIKSTAMVSDRGPLGTETYTYSNGYLSETVWNDSTVIFSLNTVNVLNQPTKVYTGPFTRTYGYSPYGLPTNRKLMYSYTTKQDYDYTFNSITGNLTSRTNNLTNNTENFTYDVLNRLTQYGTTSVTYDDYGNIVSKGDIGSFIYNDSSKPFAVTDVTLNGQMGLGSQTVTYTSFNRPSVVSENGYTATFTYNENFDRVRMVMQHNNVDSLTRYYMGGRYEADVVNDTITERLYLGGGYYDGVAVLVKKGNTSNIYYIGRDHLGSITHIIDSNGTVIQELSYDAWGRLRNPQTNAVYASGSEPKLFLGRGYCGHEHLREFGLINMNARLYDPMLGRFLSPDPYVQMPDFSQNYNRYSYCLNNPLAYVDKDGKSIFGFLIAVVAGALIGSATSFTAYAVSTLITGQSWSATDCWKAVGMGALAGAIGGAFGYAGSAMGFASTGNRIGYNLISQATNSIVTNSIYGNDMGIGDILGITAGSIAGAFLPTYKAIKASPLINTMAETAHNTLRGMATGAAQGVVDWAVKGNSRYFFQDILGGGISGFSRTVITNVCWGVPFATNSSEGMKGVYRSGGIMKPLINLLIDGITIGHNVWVDSTSDNPLHEHEQVHINQLLNYEGGWAKYYMDYLYYFLHYGSGYEHPLETPAYEHQIEYSKTHSIAIF